MASCFDVTIKMGSPKSIGFNRNVTDHGFLARTISTGTHMDSIMHWSVTNPAASKARLA